jgi:hypothetical protein
LKPIFEGWLRTKPYDKRDDLNFPIVNFTFIFSNIPAAPAYGVSPSSNNLIENRKKHFLLICLLSYYLTPITESADLGDDCCWLLFVIL